MTETLQFSVTNTKLIPTEKALVDSLKNMWFQSDVVLPTTTNEVENSDLPKLEEEIKASERIISASELDFEDRKLLKYAVYNIFDLYFLDYSVPSEINIDGIAVRFGDLKVDYIKQTRLALALATTGLSVAIIVGLLTLPQPYNLASLALCGPLFVSTYGLITQK